MGELPTMPVELIDFISEYVADEGDNKSLSALALVSSAILDLVRSRRFCKIHFQPPPRCAVRDAASCSSFAKLLTKSPSIGQYVREIIIAFGYYALPDDESMNALSLILNGIPHVRMLKLLAWPRTISWNTLPSSIQSALSSVCLQNSVISLALEGVLDLPGSLLASILQLQNLTSLTWLYIRQNPVDLIPLQALIVSSLPNLRNLRLSAQSVFGVHPFIELADVVSLVLRARAPKIEHFTCYNWYCHETRIPVQVGNMTNLKQLSLGFDYIPFSYAVLPFIRNIARGGHQSMEILELRICGILPADDIGVEAEDIAEFDHLLQERAFSNLREVQFLFLCQFEAAKKYLHDPLYSIENVMSTFTELLPRSVSRGIKLVALAPPITIYAEYSDF